jgi:WD40 repeat protein
MKRDRDLERALHEIELPDEQQAEERAWEMVRSAYAERTPVRPSPTGRRLALGLAGGLALLAIGLSPAGAKVGDLVSDVIGIGEEDAKPELRSLPAAGELLVESEQGPWIVREDGSKRLLGDYDQATWSPHGLYVTATDGRTLTTVDPAGEVRWTVTAPGPVADPRWSPGDLSVGFWIAYRSGDDLRAVDGTGQRDQLIARDVAPVAPAWRPVGYSKIAPHGLGGIHVLTYLDADGRPRAVDVDSGSEVAGTASDLEQLSTDGGTGAAAGGARRAVSPDGSRVATLEHVGRRDRLVVSADRGDSAPVLFSARGRLTGPTWSPDGRWLLVGWPEADQWVFIPTARPGGVDGVDRISEVFDPGGEGAGEFPRVAGWVLPER